MKFVRNHKCLNNKYLLVSIQFINDSDLQRNWFSSLFFILFESKSKSKQNKRQQNKAGLFSEEEKPAFLLI